MPVGSTVIPPEYTPKITFLYGYDIVMGGLAPLLSHNKKHSLHLEDDIPKQSHNLQPPSSFSRAWNEIQCHPLTYSCTFTKHHLELLQHELVLLCS